MSDTKWTPGPWACHPSAFMADGDDKRAYFIVSGLGFSGKAHANAHLIAAAPELYEALKEMLEECEDDEFAPHVMDAKAALAKARGEA